MNKRSYAPLVWFVLGFGIFMFTRMSKIVPTIPIAILISPIFILRFIRTQPTGRGNLLTLLGFIISINIGLWGLFDQDTALVYSIVRSCLLAALYFLPYMTDRWMYPKFRDKGSSSTLIFPVVTTAIFFLSSLEGPFDGAIQIGKFVFGPLVFRQQLSLFGISSFIFLSSWFASIINYAWENNFNWNKIKATSITFVSLVFVIFLFGVIKTSMNGSEQSTVKTAAIVLLPEEGDEISMDEVFAHRLAFPFEERMSRIEDLTETAASNGAQIVAFQEFAMTIHEDDEERLREEYSRIARENGVYLSITYAYFPDEGKGENIHLLINDHGEILLAYTKRYLTGFAGLLETGVFIKGPEIIQSAETPYGRIGISICRDSEFPHYFRQAGRANVDIMFVPSDEWPTGLIPSPTYMRSIEYGFSQVRPTAHGISFAVDSNGRFLAQMDAAETDDGIMYADVPTRGVNTLYTKIGDLLGWICVLGFLGLVPLNIVLSIGQKKEEA